MWNMMSWQTIFWWSARGDRRSVEVHWILEECRSLEYHKSLEIQSVSISKGSSNLRRLRVDEPSKSGDPARGLYASRCAESGRIV